MQAKKFVFVTVLSIFSHTECRIPKASELTQEQKIGQLLCIKLEQTANQQRIDDVMQTMSKYHIGGLILDKRGTVSSHIERINALRSTDMSPPPLVLLDAEWGAAMRLDDAPMLPHAMTVGATKREDLSHRMGKEIGRQAHLLGVHLVCGPVLDVNNNPKNPVINDRSFGEDPQRVTRLGIALMRGIQSAHVLACAKHFPGHGDVDVDSHLDLPQVLHKRSRLNNVELAPFGAAAQAGIKATMTAHLAVPALTGDNKVPATLSPATGDLMRNELDYNGLLITDGLNMRGLTKYHKNAAEVNLAAFKAGHDLLVMAQDVPATVERFKKALADGEITEEQLDTSVKRILEAKQWAGVTNQEPLDAELVLQQLHSAESAELKQDIFSEAVTLVNAQALPELNPQHTAHVSVGAHESYARSMDMFDQFELPSEPEGHDVTETADSLGQYDTVVVSIFSMNKFAKKQFGIHDNTLEFIDALRDTGKQVIVVLYGNPYSISLFDKRDIILCAYEDDVSAHQVVADILRGERTAHGALPVTPE